MRLASLLAIAAVAACGSFGTSKVDGSSDAASPDGGAPGLADANDEGALGPDASGPCDPAAKFVKSDRVPGLEDGTGMGMLSTDELSLYVYRRATDANLFVQKRSNRNDAFGGRIALSAFTTLSDESEPALSPDGLALVFTRNTGGDPDLWIGRRQNTDASFATVAKLGTNVNSGALDAAPYFTNTALYFASGRSGGKSQLYKASIASDAFNLAQEITELRAPNADEQTHPVVSADDSVIYFASTRTDHTPVAGNLDIFTASKNLANEFSNIRNVSELNSGNVDIPTYVSADHCRLYFVRVEAGAEKAWVATRR